MNTIPTPVLYYGQNKPLPAEVPLRAGRISMQYEDGDLRYIRIGENEILRRIYVAVRDPNWGTVSAHMSLQEMKVGKDSFTIRYRAEHHQGEIHFIWDGTIVGRSDSSLLFTMDGTAQTSFRRNRIGFCVLHPMSCAGVACTVEQTDGTIMHSIFPVDIAPHQPFLNIQAISHEVRPGLQAEVRFSGETFELEDQRNWTDASYKTYCTPLARPFPVEILAGTHLQQSVALRLIGDIGSMPVANSEAQAAFVHLTLGSHAVAKMPDIGLCVASHRQPLTSREIERLTILNLSHLRCEVHFQHQDWTAKLRQACDEAKLLRVALELALYLPQDAETYLADLRHFVDALNPRVMAWLLFGEDGVSTPPHIAALARRYLEDYEPQAQFAGGTDAFFAQLNRTRPDLEGLDLITYSITPQVHAFDNASLVETLAAQAVTLSSTSQFSMGRPLMISPVTFKVRFNPAATNPDTILSPDMLPPQVDPRHISLFGAGWTLGSLKYLAKGMAQSVTYYETTGWLGVMEMEADPPLPGLFPSLTGAVFPLFHVFADVGEWRWSDVIQMESTKPLIVDGLALRHDKAMCLLLVNFTASVQTVHLSGVCGSWDMRVLDELTAHKAMTDPEGFRVHLDLNVTAEDDELTLELAPFAVARLTSKGD